jgi:hypothetical protein
MTIPRWYEDWLRAGRSVNERGVFFVGGCQKSGTTWLQRLLNAHPHARCGGEGHLAGLLTSVLQQAVNAYNRRQAQRAPDLQVMLGRDDLLGAIKGLSDRILASYLPKGAAAKEIRAVGDKTPEHAQAVAVLDELYPQSRFVHVIRDGRDACISGWFHLKRQGRSGQFASLADYADYFAEHHWVPYINAARTAGERLPDRYHEIRYESLHADPHAETRQLLAFLQIDASDETVNTCLGGASFEKLAGGRSRGEEDKSSFFRKGVVGDWREHFDAAAARRFETKGGRLLAELGYATAAATA